jgi:hypothetical protein
MIRNILAAVLLLPFAITLFLAIAGAFVALGGGLFGWENLRTSGGAAAGLGALGFFGWLFVLMRFELLSVLDVLPMGKAAQPKAVVSSKKDLE